MPTTDQPTDSDAAREVQDRVNREAALFEPKPEEGEHAGELMVLPMHSRIEGPIDDLSRLEKALLFAELSNASYLDEKSAVATVAQAGFEEVEFFDRDGAQAYRFANERDCVIACRGTEPHDINDVKADVDAAFAIVETVGRVHRGFNTEVDDLWPRIERSLLAEEASESKRTIWFCGHSLGGAMATICAGRCFHSPEVPDPEGLYTFGSPRVGDKQYINYCTVEHVRLVNNNDIVPRLPPRIMGFRHHGKELYLDHKGRVRRKMRFTQKFADRLRGFGKSLLRFKVDQLHDHIVDQYIGALKSSIDREAKRAGR